MDELAEIPLQNRIKLPRVVVASTVLDLQGDTAALRGARRHDFLTLYFLADGSLQVITNGVPSELPPASMLLLPPSAQHELAVAPGSDLWVAGFYLDALDGFRVMLDRARPPIEVPLSVAITPRSSFSRPIAATQVDAKRWRSYLSLLRSRLLEEHTAREFLAPPLLALLSIDFVRLSTPPTLSPEILHAMLAYIEMHYHFPISARNVAVALDRSPAYLTTMVRRETGLAVLQWIVLRRMIAARQLLRSTTEPLARVAEQSGYSDVNNFTRQFTALHRITPGLWRKIAQSGSRSIDAHVAETAVSLETLWRVSGD